MMNRDATLKKQMHGNSLAVQWLGLRALTVGVWVQSLVGELRPHKPCGRAKKILKINK